MLYGMIDHQLPFTLITQSPHRRMSARPRKVGLKCLPLLLALLLVVMQTGAVLHALGHLSDGERSGSPAVPQHAVCALCAAYAGYDGALTTAAPSVAALGPVTLGHVAPRFRLHLPPPALPYQVRAPPPLAGV
jgi:hypothetical protein